MYSVRRHVYYRLSDISRELSGDCFPLSYITNNHSEVRIAIFVDDIYKLSYIINISQVLYKIKANAVFSSCRWITSLAKRCYPSKFFFGERAIILNTKRWSL